MIDFPANPTVGQLFTVGTTTWVWDGAKWTFSAGGTGVTLTIADVAPANPILGSLWWDSTKGQLYLWYNDGNSSQWAPTTNQLGGGYLPLTGGALSGNLTINGVNSNVLTINGPSNIWPGIALDTVAGQGAWIGSYIGGNERWEIDLGNGNAESGTSTGSDFQIVRFANNGSFIDDPFIIRRQDGAVTIGGTQTNDNANNNAVGQVISTNTTSAVTLATTVPINIASISLPPGDWDVQGEIWFALTGVAQVLTAGINNVSATQPTVSALNTAYNRIQGAAAGVYSGNWTLPVRTCRVSLAATTTYYLIAFCNFSTGAVTCTGNIWARRAR
jgi:hypothetical protein